MFKKQIEYQVVEIERPKPLDEGARESVLSLQHHPGFQYLIGKLKLQRASLDSILKRNRHDDMRTVDFLQSGIAWMSYLEEFVNKEVYNAGKPPSRPAQEDEVSLFKAAAANLDLL
jgi:hypothetical protein